jgi:Mn-containing catalase
MQQDELKKFLTDIAAERLALLQRHEAAARVVGHYDFNNTYQYVIAREETHLSWLQSALAEIGAELPQSTLPLTAPEAPKGKRQDSGAYHEILAADAKFLVRSWPGGENGCRPSRTPVTERCSTWCSANRSSISVSSIRRQRASRT